MGKIHVHNMNKLMLHYTYQSLFCYSYGTDLSDKIRSVS